MKLKGMVQTVLCLCLMCFSCSGIAASAETRALNSQWSDPATVIKVTEENRELIYSQNVSPDSDETYSPLDRRFQGMASIEVTGARIWAAWTVGGDMEPHVDNYIVLGYSDDGGKTWVDPFLIIDHDDAAGIGVKVCVPNLWLAPNGELWCFYVQNGTCAIVIPDPTASPDSISWTEPRYLFSVFRAQKKPTVIENASGEEEWLITCENGATEDGKYIKSPLVYASTDGGETWALRGIATSEASDKRFQEAQIIQLESGRLWMLARIERGSGGGVEEYYSDDYGCTWGNYSANLPRPLISPGSKFHIMRLQSGNLLWVTNSSTSTRTDLTAFISDDDGETWSDGLLLDDRSIVAYPDAAQDEEGNIYVIWDRNRSQEQEIRFSVFSEQELRSGVMSTDRSRLLIAKNHEYREIVSLQDGFMRSLEVKLGTPSSEIYAKLPASLVVYDDAEQMYTLNGTWKTDNYNKTKEGVYVFYFECDLPDQVEDMRGLLNVNVSVVEDKATPAGPASSCAGLIGSKSVLGLCLPVVSIGTVALIVRKRKKKNV